MTYDEFIGKWNTRGIDFDGAYGDQCMDLMHQYVFEVLGVTDGRVLAAPAAKDVYLNFDNVVGHDKFEKIANTPTGVPQKGDIILWGTGIGPYGHVAIFLDGDANKFRSFDQNFPTGSKCHLQDHTYTGVLGWLRFKGTPSTTGPEMYKGYDLTNRESMKAAVDVLVRVQGGEFVDRPKYDADLKSKQDTIDNLNQQINDRNNDIVQLNAKISTLETQVTESTTRIESLETQAKRVPELENLVSEFESRRTQWAEQEKTYNRVIGQLKSENESLKKHPGVALILSILEKFGLKS